MTDAAEQPAERPVDRPVEQPVEQPVDRPTARPGRRSAGRTVRVGAALAVLVAGAVGARWAWTGTNLLGPDRLCGGALPASAASGLLGSGRLADTAFDQKAARLVPGCSVTRTAGLLTSSTDTVVLQTTLAEVSASLGPATAPAGSAVVGGGRVGVLSARGGWLLLPAGCDGRAPTGTGKDGAPGPGRAWQVEASTVRDVPPQALLTLLAAAADGYARTAGCPAPGGEPAGRVLAPASAAAATPDALCGLPGLRAPWAAGAFQQAVPRSAPIWTCDLGAAPGAADPSVSGEAGGRPFLRLVVVTDSRLATSEARTTRLAEPDAQGRPVLTAGADEVLARCGDRPVLVAVTPGDGAAPAGTAPPDSGTLLRGLLTATQQAQNCGGAPWVPAGS
ncbi:hypothetical protein OG455_16385 [Kitasatospora sp. NBC_01287]|uniref:hypothetical protein n=1 Tax=Kitasatospora sp. NBC_01287 TaxID=2903573 RepID=UPI00225937C2|nr:hypothetical protein [Kitasatospora sp. NBC_01287]MCX4747082.1 hypothetical protein [Kitasatospora sp. NBC_01287]